MMDNSELARKVAELRGIDLAHWTDSPGFENVWEGILTDYNLAFGEGGAVEEIRGAGHDLHGTFYDDGSGFWAISVGHGCDLRKWEESFSGVSAVELPLPAFWRVYVAWKGGDDE